jgi:hypothetical protein
MTPPLPGRWVRTEHKTHLFEHYQIRRRPDGDFDIREVHRREPHVVHRGVSASYVYAEFVLPEGVSWNDLRR